MYCYSKMSKHSQFINMYMYTYVYFFILFIFYLFFEKSFFI